MDKKIKTIVILMCILAGLCVCFACVTLWFDADTTEAETTPTPNTNTVILKTDTATISSLSFTFDKAEDGVAESWTYTCDEGVWHWSEDADISLSASGFATLTQGLLAVTAERTIANVTEAQLSKYGLDAPSKSISVKDDLYGLQTVYFGAFNAYNQMYYVTVGNDTSTVYMVSAELYDLFEYPVEAFVSYNDLPGKLDQSQIVSLTFERGDTLISVLNKPIYEEVTGEVETGEDASPTISGYVWEKVKGDEVTTLSGTLAETLTSHVTQMNYLGCLTVVENEYATYGFDKDTATLTLTYLDKAGETKTVTMTLGGQTDYGYYYARPQSTPYIMLLGGVSFAQVFDEFES